MLAKSTAQPILLNATTCRGSWWKEVIYLPLNNTFNVMALIDRYNILYLVTLMCIGGQCDKLISLTQPNDIPKFFQNN